ncbi:MAG: Glyoxylate reductase [Candidatus Roizmanbacteria bacterium GW2011_GWA2_36_23]|uniref:Glyoxylate reductase n=1 Tax=Candidatus Roizmanbacteria bacterium GW2011_GWA2_36_23 TaxID=1618480 RepID=A0A0G0E8V7_9BACT|nr:MAG: Glyoxylate reductase [Candidatus Roizmanbacteria bacterium GW2011_GWA2_36_23]
MKTIFVAPKINIPEELINKLQKYSDIYFFEDSPIDIRNIKMLKEKGDKILCPFPEPLAWKFPNEFIKEIPDLKAICLSTTSYSWIDGKLASSMGVQLTNVPNPPNAAAESAIFSMFGVAKKFVNAYKEKQFEYIPSNFLLEVTNKTMGVIGLGKIGSRIAELGKNLGMNVIYWSRKTRNNKYKYVDLQVLFKTADFIFTSIALNEDTDNLVSAKLIDMMKPESSIIANINSEVVDVDYLLRKVKEKKIYGCALSLANKTINDYEGNVFLLPINNWYTKETVEQKMKIWIENIIAVIKGSPLNLVN